MNKILDPNKTSSYDYFLPKELIATSPANPPDSARLLVYNRAKNSITHSTFRHLLDFLPPNINILLNDTKVIKARIFGKKISGGKVELLLNKPMEKNTFLCMIKGKVQINTEIFFEQSLKAVILRLNNDGTREVKFFQNKTELDFLALVELLNKIGHLPLPPYMNREDKKSDEVDYQTIFAKNYGAVAAPTASLHFTPELLNKIKQAHNVDFLTLHVGAGTFKGVEVENINEHQMHSEYYNIPKSSIKLINEPKPLLAVGTTVTRTIENFIRTNKEQGENNLFLNPENKPLRVDLLLTNFHLPQSTLIMLVASFIELEKTLEIYETAIKNNYRFYSYGDAMLIV